MLSISAYQTWRRRYPFSPVLLGFAIGIFWGYRQSHVTTYSLALLVFSSLISLGLTIYQAYTKPQNSLAIAQHITMIIAFMASGHTYFHYRNPTAKKGHFATFEGTIEAYEAVVIDEIIRKQNFYTTQVAVNRICIAGQWHSAHGRVQVSGLGFSYHITYGDLLSIRGSPTTVGSPQNPYTFNQQLFLQTKGIYHEHHLAKNSLKKLGHQPQNTFSITMIALRQWCTTQLTKHIINPEVSALLLATLLGIRTHLDAILKETYSQTGVMHILAVSGLHVGLLYFLLLLLLYLLSSLWQRPRQHHGIALIVLWMYAFLTGLSPSVLRAVLMITLVQLGKRLHRDILTLNILAITAFLLLLYNPYWLFSVSFQLSFTAVLGILLFYQPLANTFSPDNPIALWFWQVSILSIAAQLGTLPISLYYFHFLPTYCLVGNWLMIPMASIMLISGFALLVTAPLSSVSKLIALVIQKLLGQANKLLDYLANLPYATFGPFFPPIWVVGLSYLTLATTYWTIKKKQRTYFILTILLASILATYTVHHHYQQSKQKQIIFYSVYPYHITAFVKGRQATLIAHSKVERHHFTYHREVAPSLQAIGIQKITWLPWDMLKAQEDLDYQTIRGLTLFRWQGKRIAFVEDSTELPKQLLAIDFLLIHSDDLPKLQPHLNNWEIGQIIVIGPAHKPANALDYIYFLSEQGAYIADYS